MTISRGCLRRLRTRRKSTQSDGTLDQFARDLAAFVSQDCQLQRISSEQCVFIHLIRSRIVCIYTHHEVGRHHIGPR